MQFQSKETIAHDDFTHGVINSEFANAKLKFYLKTSIMIIIGEQSSK